MVENVHGPYFEFVPGGWQYQPGRFFSFSFQFYPNHSNLCPWIHPLMPMDLPPFEKTIAITIRHQRYLNKQHGRVGPVALSKPGC